MARGPRKSKSEKLSETLQKVEEEIVKVTERQKELQAEKKRLQEEIKEMQLKDLTDLLSKTNMSVEELTEMIQTKTASEGGDKEVAATMEK